MKGYLIYLAGGITGLKVGEANDWRKQVRDALPEHIQTISPLRGKQRLLETEQDLPIEKSYEGNPLTTSRGINTRDHFDVMRSDVLLVNLLNAKVPSLGTVMEIAWAWAYRKPVILIAEPGNVHEHPMIDECTGFRVSTLEEGIALLQVVIGPDKYVGD